MKIAVIADIHSNYYALKEFYKYIKRNAIDVVIFAGDYITNLPYVNETMNLIFKIKKEFKSYFVFGNREEYVINFNENTKINSRSGNIYYTYHHIDGMYFDFLKTLPKTQKLNFGMNKTIFIAHSTEKNTRVLMLPEEQQTKDYMDSVEARYIICAHSHKQFIYKYNNKVLINPGAFGMFSDYKKTCSFAVLDETVGNFNVELINLEYNVECILSDFKNSDFLEYSKMYGKAIEYSFYSGYDFSGDMIEYGNAGLSENDKEKLYQDFYRQAVKQYDRKNK